MACALCAFRIKSSLTRFRICCPAMLAATPLALHWTCGFRRCPSNCIAFTCCRVMRSNWPIGWAGALAYCAIGAFVPCDYPGLVRYSGPAWYPRVDPILVLTPLSGASGRTKETRCYFVRHTPGEVCNRLGHGGRFRAARRGPIPPAGLAQYAGTLGCPPLHRGGGNRNAVIVKKRAALCGGRLGRFCVAPIH